MYFLLLGLISHKKVNHVAVHFFKECHNSCCSIVAGALQEHNQSTVPIDASMCDKPPTLELVVTICEQDKHTIIINTNASHTKATMHACYAITGS